MFKLHHLRDFVAIANAQTLRGAARALGMAQPTLTRSLRELEEDLGVALVDRHARGVRLTDAGHRFLERATSVLEELRRAREESVQVVGEITGSVMVGMSGGAVLAFVPIALPQFSREYPRVRLRIAEGMFPVMEQRLRSGQIDFYVGPRPEHALDRAYHCELLFQNRRQVIGRKDHPLAGARSLRDLLSAEWMLTGLRERAVEEFEEQFAMHGMPSPVPVMQADSGLTALVLLSSTDLLAFLPHQWGSSHVSREQLQAIPVREALTAPDIVMISRAGIPLTPAAERFCVVLRRAVAQPFKRVA